MRIPCIQIHGAYSAAYSGEKHTLLRDTRRSRIPCIKIHCAYPALKYSALHQDTRCILLITQWRKAHTAYTLYHDTQHIPCIKIHSTSQSGEKHTLPHTSTLPLLLLLLLLNPTGGCCSVCYQGRRLLLLLPRCKGSSSSYW